VSKKINGKNFFFEKLSVSILTQFSGKLVLNQERQLISIFQKKCLENFLTKKTPERYIFIVQEILNKLFIMKQKLLGRTFYRDKNTSEFKQQLIDTIEIKNNFRKYTYQIENTFKNEKFQEKNFISYRKKGINK
jgi:hypothetical protein